jgi:hypothetical protein
MNVKMEEHAGLYKALVLSAISGLLSVTNIEIMLKLLLLTVSIAYTCFKFYEDYKKSKK